MKLNNKEITLQQVKVERIDDIFTMYNSVTKKVVQFNDTSSFVWNIILEYNQSYKDLDTAIICRRIMEAYKIQTDREQDVFCDIEEILLDFIDSGLIIFTQN